MSVGPRATPTRGRVSSEGAELTAVVPTVGTRCSAAAVATGVARFRTWLRPSRVPRVSWPEVGSADSGALAYVLVQWHPGRGRWYWGRCQERLSGAAAEAWVGAALGRAAGAACCVGRAASVARTAAISGSSPGRGGKTRAPAGQKGPRTTPTSPAAMTTLTRQLNGSYFPSCPPALGGDGVVVGELRGSS